MEQLQKENSELVKSILERTYFTAWKNQRFLKDSMLYGNYSHLELQISGSCDLKCSYCYYAKYSKELYPAKISGKKNVLKKLEMVLNWLDENQYYPRIELFSGEIFSQELGFKCLKRIIDWLKEKDIEEKMIVIPTNFSFIFDDEKTKRVDSLLNECKDNYIQLYLSCSIDGKYCDDNRPFKDGKIRDELYYDKLFRFCKKWNFNFHPMIYSKNIEKWKDNWLWFQDMFKKYEIHPENIYLLEVRNAEWTREQLKEFYNFFIFLYRWTFDYLQKIENIDIYQTIFKSRIFNIFSILSKCGRGIGCSIQGALQLRLGDLTTSLCHRAAYKQHNLWRFKTDNNRITDIEGLNHNLMIAMFSADHSVFPMCETCFLKALCNYQCLGSMYETNKDPIAPIPTVCALEHIKAAALLNTLKEYNLHYGFLSKVDDKKYKAMKYYYNNFFKGE